MEAIKKAIELILERIGLVLLIAGIGLVMVGGSGNVPYVPIHQREAQIALAVFGVVLAAVGIWLEIRGSGVKPLGIEILTPINGAHLEEQWVFSGTIKKAIPADQQFWLARFYSDQRFYPVTEIVVGRSDKQWSKKIHVGGKRGDTLDIGVLLVGEAGLALIEYQREAAQRHQAAWRRLNVRDDDPDRYLPAFKKSWLKPLGIKEGHRVSVTRL